MTSGDSSMERLVSLCVAVAVKTDAEYLLFFFYLPLPIKINVFFSSFFIRLLMNGLLTILAIHKIRFGFWARTRMPFQLQFILLNKWLKRL